MANAFTSVYIMTNGFCDLVISDLVIEKYKAQFAALWAKMSCKFTNLNNETYSP